MDNRKLPPLVIQKLASIIASSDSSSDLYMKGPELVDLFNNLGFPDTYTFVEGRGIQTADFGEGLSRLTYTLRRIESLNKSSRVYEACSLFVARCKNPGLALEKINEVLSASALDAIVFHEKVDSGEVVTYPDKDEGNDLLKPIEQVNSDESISKELKILQDSILGEIPSDRKVVFISYSWDSKEHQEWVGQLADDLTKNGIYVLYDGYNEDGTPIDMFMELGIQRADKVIVIGTPNFLLKYNASSSGAAFEGYIIRAYVIQSVGTKKIIPCLRKGNYKLSFPMILSSRKGHDFSDDNNYELELEDLCREIWEKPKRQRPMLGAIPKYVTE